MRKHKEGVHSKGVRLKCDECDLMLKTTTMESHVKRVHRGVKPTVPCSEEGCGKVFGSKADLERHVLGKHMKWKAPCPECGKKFRMECLHQHIMTVHKGIYPFKCPHCEQGFQNQKGLSTHVRIRHQGLYLYCRTVNKKGLECGKVILSEEGLINHIECKHLGPGGGETTSCPQCQSVVFSCYLAEHVRREHLADSELLCPVETCGELARDRSGLREHVDTEHDSLGLEWCEECEEFSIELAEHKKLRHEVGLWEGAEFRPMFGIMLGTRCHHLDCSFMATGPTHLARHVKLSHELRVSVKCELCGKKTFNMEKHMKIQHDKEKTLECEYCQKMFLTPFILKKHMETHTSLESRLQSCPKCGVEVTNMKQHERYVHQKDLPYSCDEEGCETRFTSKNHRRKHIESVHEKTKTECPQCGKIIGLGSMNSHIKFVHEKRRDYVCPQCQKTFQNKSHLRNHVQRVHLHMREECPQCGKMVQDLHNHRQFVHLGVKNFPCKHCETRCTTSTALKKHISSVHLGEVDECPMCGDKVKHLEQHIKQRHSDMKKKYQCAECEKFFSCGSYLSKHIMRVHLEMRETCTDCGLETKDLKRHLKTNCSRDGYSPRARKRRVKEEDGEDVRMMISPMQSVPSTRVLRAKDIKKEIHYDEDSEDDMELIQEFRGSPGAGEGGWERGQIIGDQEDAKEELEEQEDLVQEEQEDQVQEDLVQEESGNLVQEEPRNLGQEDFKKLVQMSPELEESSPSPTQLDDDDLYFKKEAEDCAEVRVRQGGFTNNNGDSRKAKESLGGESSLATLSS